MKIKTNPILLAAFATIAFGVASTSHAAAYIKFEGVKGESKMTASQPALVKSSQAEKPAALLLPAVQAAREAARRNTSSKGKKKGNVEYSWKVEEGVK